MSQRKPGERGGDLNLTPRGELWFSLAFLALLAGGAFALWMYFLGQYPADPTGTTPFGDAEYGWHIFLVTLWWTGTILLPLVVILAGVAAFAMIYSERFRNIIMFGGGKEK